MIQATKRGSPSETCWDKDENHEIDNDQLLQDHPDWLQLHLDDDDDAADADAIIAHLKYLKERIRTDLVSTTELPTDYWTEPISIDAFDDSALVTSPTPTASPLGFQQSSKQIWMWRWMSLTALPITA